MITVEQVIVASAEQIGKFGAPLEFQIEILK